MQVNVDTNLVDMNFKLYKYDQDEKCGLEYVEGSDGFNLDLNDFDNFIRERNAYNANIIRFHVSLPNAGGSELAYRKISVTADIDETVIDSNFNGGFTDRVQRTYNDEQGYKYHNASQDHDYMCNNISNIVYFKGFAYTYEVDGVTHKVDESITIDESSPTSIYLGARDVFESRSTQFTFVSGGEKSTQLQFDLEEIDSKATSIIFYIEYNYNIDLVDTFLNNTEIVGSQDTSMMSSRIVFQKDINTVTISAMETDEWLAERRKLF